MDKAQSINTLHINMVLSLLEQYNAAYRTGNPQISDAQYDSLVDELRLLDPKNDWFKKPEPVPVANARKVKLPIPMKSLDKAKTLEEVRQWVKSLGLQDERLIITPKFDGVSLLYDQKTRQAFSRGGAENEGQDCTEYAAKVSGIHRNELAPEIHYTFGELVFRVNSWKLWFAGRISLYSGTRYRSPRNTIAGLINRDAPDDELQYTTFFRYGVDAKSLEEFDTYDELYAYLCGVYGQPCLKEWAYADSLDEQQLHKCFDKWSKEFYIDGLVIYIDNLELWNMIGRHQTSGNPRYAIAYKNPDFTPVYETTVKNVTWKISKSGALKPVVNVDTVDTGDCDIENPTGYNAKYIFENSIGSGAVIKLTRSGGVIPKILEVIEEASAKTMMQQRADLLYCPHCGQPTTWNKSHVELVCTNPDCPGIAFAKICHFYKTVGAEYMGEETLLKIFQAGYDTLAKILDITFKELMLIDTFGEHVSNVVLSTNKKIRGGVEITKLMHASDCFKGIGQTRAKSFLELMDEHERFAFVNGMIPSVGPAEEKKGFDKFNKTTQSFLKGVKPFYEFIRLNRLTILPMEEKAVVGDKCKGYRVCFTGIRDKETEEMIVMEGGEIANGVSKNTTHLIVADTGSESGKAKKARSLGIPIMTLDDFKNSLL